MDANECKTKENIHNNKRKLNITREKNTYTEQLQSCFLFCHQCNYSRATLEIGIWSCRFFRFGVAVKTEKLGSSSV